MHVMLNDAQVAGVIIAFADAKGLAVSYASRIATGSADTVARIEHGTSLTLRRASRIIQWLSDHWPSDVDWPPEIPRPAPAAPPPPATRAEVLAAVEAAMARREAAIESYRADEGDWNAVEAALREAQRLAATLVDGVAVEEAALLAVPGASRRTLRDVRRRGGGARPGTLRAKLLAVLAASGDPRYAGRMAA